MEGSIQVAPAAVPVHPVSEQSLVEVPKSKKTEDLRREALQCQIAHNKKEALFFRRANNLLGPLKNYLISMVNNDAPATKLSSREHRYSLEE